MNFIKNTLKIAMNTSVFVLLTFTQIIYLQNKVILLTMTRVYDLG